MPAMIEEKTGVKEKKTKKVVKRKTVDKWKKKKWFSIVAPAFFNQQQLGETIAEEPEQLMQRSILCNAADITNQAKLRPVSLKFAISGVQGQKAFTEFCGHEIKDAYLRKMIRRRSSKIEIVEDLNVKSGEKIRVKAITITNRKASQNQKTEIRKIMKKELENAAAKKLFEQLVQELIFGNISANIFKSTKKIFPIKRIEINKSIVLKQKAA